MKKIKFFIVLVCFSLLLCACSFHKKSTEVLIEEVTTEDLKDISIKEAHIGDIVSFGHYEQDMDIEGKEEILWDVLDETDDSVLLISHYIIDTYKFSENLDDVTWTDSDLRYWLNEDFFSETFTEIEKEEILITKVDNTQTDEYKLEKNSNPSYRKKEEGVTEDKIFILSLDEAKKYYGAHVVNLDGNNKQWYSNCIASTYTPYVAKKICYYKVKDKAQTELKGDFEVDIKDCNWWMRTESGIEWKVLYTDYEGYISSYWVAEYRGVRPAMWVKKK